MRITESKLMQAQINPHFLYNTLDNDYVACGGEENGGGSFHGGFTCRNSSVPL